MKRNEMADKIYDILEKRQNLMGIQVNPVDVRVVYTFMEAHR